MTEPAAVRFFHAWDTYAKVVAANYMYHRELGAAVRAALRGRFGEQPFSVLDLGCGDAATFAPLLVDFHVKSYSGADLSEAALAIARANLSALSCPVDLRQADLMSELAGAGAHDVIYISFALHHLTTANKAAFFRLAAERLTPGGLLLHVDVVREEGQSLPDYLDAYSGWVRRTMATLAAPETEAICEHLIGNDMPEPASVLTAQASAAGLRLIDAAAPQVWHRLLVFAKD
jgi:SAM-dependent methyltransferase